MTDRSNDKADERQIDRRGLLRTGGVAVVAGVAGLAVAEVASAGPAGAAPGSDVTVDGNNTGTGTTSLTSSDGDGPTLDLGNSGGGAPLRLEETGNEDDPFDALGVGDLSVIAGDLYYTADPDGEGDPFTGFVLTIANANQIVPIIPQRALDTRTAAGRARVTNPSVLDSQGRLIGGKSIILSLADGEEDDYEFGATAAFCNLTVDAPTAAGYATVYPGGTVPSTSSINFAKGQAIANSAVVGITEGEDFDSISIYAQVTTHIILDITAFSADLFGVNPEILPVGPQTANAAGLTKKKTTRAAPSWSRKAR